MKNSSIFLKPADIRKFTISQSLKKRNTSNDLFLEFGVFRGDSINLFSEFLSKKNLTIYGFDSFEGLEEEWNMNEYNPIGTFSLNKKKPKVSNNVKLIVGKVQETLESFLKENKDKKITFAHLDMDTYTPTKFTLEKIKPYLVKNSIIVFDQLYNYLGWKNGEFKALKEEFKEDEYLFRGFNVCDKQCYIQMK